MNKIFKQTHNKRGFSVIELMVSIGIVVLVLGIVLTRNAAFNSAVLLRSEAYDMALQIREVQLQAVSATGVAADFRRVAGVHFNTSATTKGYYQSFRDQNNDNYLSSTDNNIISRVLDARFEVDSIQLMNGTLVASTPTNLSIVFRRPNFDALFYISSGTAAASNITAARIVIRRVGTGTATGAGDIRTVEITKTGQITVQ